MYDPAKSNVGAAALAAWNFAIQNLRTARGATEIAGEGKHPETQHPTPTREVGGARLPPGANLLRNLHKPKYLKLRTPLIVVHHPQHLFRVTQFTRNTPHPLIQPGK